MPVNTIAELQKTPKQSEELDLLSISQTNSQNDEQTYAQNFSICHNNAPYFAIQNNDNSYSLWQGCCNDWTCPRCGLMRAKSEYGRIVEGCRTLAVDYELYFVTITCRGRDLSAVDANANYLYWTNKLLTTWRTSSKRKGIHWCYVQVTERQKRGHPHSHIITTAKPHDTYLGKRAKWSTDNHGNRIKTMVDALRSDWFERANVRVGLGKEYDISKVDSVEGTSRYVAKYLFKDSMFDTQWAKNWHRVRYSQNFPKRKQKHSDNDVIPLVKQDDWLDFARQAKVLKISEEVSRDDVAKRMNTDVLFKVVKRVDNLH